jgi:hypothetical protein
VAPSAARARFRAAPVDYDIIAYMPADESRMTPGHDRDPDSIHRIAD